MAVQPPGRPSVGKMGGPSGEPDIPQLANLLNQVLSDFSEHVQELVKQPNLADNKEALTSLQQRTIELDSISSKASAIKVK